MNKLWGMIKALQIILMLPLTYSDIPPNVQLLYYFMNSNFNIQLIPSSSDPITLFPLYGGSYPSQEAFTDQFSNQDIF
jgi:hypothetical protein